MEKLPNWTRRVEARVRALYGLLICSGPKLTWERIDGNARQWASHVALAFCSLLKIRLARDWIRERALTPDLLYDPQQKGTICAACVLTPSSGSPIGSLSGSLSHSKKIVITRTGSDHVQDTNFEATFAVSDSKLSRMPPTLHSPPCQDGAKVPLKRCATLLSL